MGLRPTVWNAPCSPGGFKANPLVGCRSDWDRLLPGLCARGAPGRAISDLGREHCPIAPARASSGCSGGPGTGPFAGQPADDCPKRQWPGNRTGIDACFRRNTGDRRSGAGSGAVFCSTARCRPDRFHLLPYHHLHCRLFSRRLSVRSMGGREDWSLCGIRAERDRCDRARDILGLVFKATIPPLLIGSLCCAAGLMHGEYGRGRASLLPHRRAAIGGHSFRGERMHFNRDLPLNGSGTGKSELKSNA